MCLILWVTFNTNVINKQNIININKEKFILAKDQENVNDICQL